MPSPSIAKNCTILVDGYDLSCAFKELKMARKTDEIDTTALCTTGNKTFIPGLKEGSLSLTGIYDYDGTNLDKIENVLQTAFSNQSISIVSASLGALAVGGIAFQCRGGQVKKDVESVKNQLIMTMADIHAQGNIFSGKWLFGAQMGDSATTVGTSVDNLVPTTNGGVLHFHAVTTIPGLEGTDSQILVEHSVDGTTWATLITSTAIGAGHGAFAVQVAAGTTVRRYLRATVTSDGAGALCYAAFYRG